MIRLLFLAGAGLFAAAGSGSSEVLAHGPCGSGCGAGPSCAPSYRGCQWSYRYWDGRCGRYVYYFPAARCYYYWSGSAFYPIQPGAPAAFQPAPGQAVLPSPAGQQLPATPAPFGQPGIPVPGAAAPLPGEQPPMVPSPAAVPGPATPGAPRVEPVPSLPSTPEAKPTSPTPQAKSLPFGGQKTCPVTGEDLGSMGKPIPVTVKGQTIYVCCQGCVRQVQRDPDTFLRKVEAERRGGPKGQP